MKQARLPINKGTIIVSDRKRSIWVVYFIGGYYIFLATLMAIDMSENHSLNEVFDLMINKTAIVLIIILTVIGLSYRQRLYIDLENKRYRPTIETGPLKLGRWVNIKNPEYISVFYKGHAGLRALYQVNLWFDSNRHINLFEMHNEDEAMDMGFEVSEILNIDLLDATEHGNFKWIDKDAWREQDHEDSKKITKQIKGPAGS